MQIEKIMLYTKQVKFTKEGKETKFPKFLAKINDRFTFEVQLSNDCKADLEKQLAKGDYQCPVEISLEHYFMKKEKYTNSKGEDKTKNVLVIMDCKVLKQAEFEEIKLEDIIEELDQEKNTNITTEEDPF